MVRTGWRLELRSRPVQLFTGKREGLVIFAVCRCIFDGTLRTLLNQARLANESNLLYCPPVPYYRFIKHSPSFIKGLNLPVE